MSDMTYRRAAYTLATVLTVVCVAQRTAAWTRAHVHSAHATIDVLPNASMQVHLTFDLQVEAGWLHQLELMGLESGIEIHPRKPPYLQSQEGKIYRPEYNIDDRGTIHLIFKRREAPKQGQYKAVLNYHIAAASQMTENLDTDRSLVTWTLPGWDTGLHNLSIEFHTPIGTRLPKRINKQPPGIDVNIHHTRNSTVIRWQRVYLPRMTAWPLSVEIPLAILPPTHNQETQQPTLSLFHPLPHSPPAPKPWYLLVITLVALAKRALNKPRESPRLAISWTSVFPSTIALVAVGFLFPPYAPLCTLPIIALGMHKACLRDSIPHGQQWQATLSSPFLQKPGGIADWFDGTQVTGVATLFIFCLVFTLMETPAMSWILLPLFFTGTRFHQWPTHYECVKILRKFSSLLRLPKHAPQMGLVWEHDQNKSYRLSMKFDGGRSGLIDLSFMVGVKYYGPILQRQVVVVIHVRAQSKANDVLRQLLPSWPWSRSANGAIMRVLPWHADTLKVIGILAEHQPVLRQKITSKRRKMPKSPTTTSQPSIA